MLGAGRSVPKEDDDLVGLGMGNGRKVGRKLINSSMFGILKPIIDRRTEHVQFSIALENPLAFFVTSGTTGFMVFPWGNLGNFCVRRGETGESALG